MAEITAGYRIIFRAYGMRLQPNRDFTVTLKLGERFGKRPEFVVHLGGSPYGGSAGLDTPLPRFVERSGEPLHMHVRPMSGDRPGGGPPQFADVLVLDRFEIDDPLAERWAADHEATARELDAFLSSKVRYLAPMAELTAAYLALMLDEGAVKERISEGEVYFYNGGFRYYSASDPAEIVDLWRLEWQRFEESLPGLMRLNADPRHLPSVALASHWYLRTMEAGSAVDRFLSYFLCLEVLSHLSLRLPMTSVLPAPWESRAADLLELNDRNNALDLEVIRRLVRKLREMRFTEPTLNESFDRLVDLHPRDARNTDKEAFRELGRIRNDLMHGRRADIPPTLGDGRSTILAIMELAKCYLRATVGTLVRIGPEVDVQGFTEEPPNPQESTSPDQPTAR